VIVHSGGPASITFGELDGRTSQRARHLLAWCEQAGFEAELSGSIKTVLWGKLAFICAQAGMTAAVRLPIEPMRDDSTATMMPTRAPRALPAPLARIAERLKLRQDVYLGEINLGPFYCSYYGAKNSRRYQPIPRFPAVERDFSLLLSDATRFSEVAKSISSLNIPEIASIEAADLFRGKNVPAGKYSLLVKISLQSREATLTDTQINDISSRIVSVLEKQLGAQLRTA